MSTLMHYVARFDKPKGDYVRWTGSLSLAECRRIIKKARAFLPDSEFQIIAVLDE